MKERICPKCGAKHKGEGLSPSVSNRNICGVCYKAKEIARTKAYRNEPSNQSNLPDYKKDFDINMKMYIENKIMTNSKFFNIDEVYLYQYADFITEIKERYAGNG